MVIAGPNGVGKSTLLHAMQQRVGAVLDEGTAVIYQPPHRAIRRQSVRRRFLGGPIRSLFDFFSALDLPGVEGLSIPSPSRAPDSVDEAGSTIKYVLGGIENRRQTALALLVDRSAETGLPVQGRDLPDVYAPLRRLTQRLLPHLEFSRIDFANEDDIRCVFRRSDAVEENELDLDDLSSGEKTVFTLFLPMIEQDLNRLMTELSPSEALRGEPDRLVLIDEPEQHLHPDLVTRVLAYIREEAARGGLQFILATHSPTLVDQALDDELYVMGFPRTSADNQLRRIATNEDRLETLRLLAGNTYFLTTGRSIVCVEGTRDSDTRPTDVGLLGVLHPRATRYTVVPAGGKGNVIRVVQELRENLPADLGLRVYGLVDSDRAESAPHGIIAWPVASVENLLLDEQSIAQAVSRLSDGIALPTAEEIRALFEECGKEARDDEIRLRVGDSLGVRTVRLAGVSVDDVAAQIEAESIALQRSREEIEGAVSRAVSAVDDAIADGSYIQKFRGKHLLRCTYRRLGLGDLNVSYKTFSYGVAGACADRESVQTIMEEVFGVVDEDEPDSPASGTSRVG
jgi:ABC-type branched-subunit amino acid transport system ATPase component